VKSPGRQPFPGGPFRKLEELPLEAIGKVASAQSVDDFAEIYEKARRKRR